MSPLETIRCWFAKVFSILRSSSNFAAACGSLVGLFAVMPSVLSAAETISVVPQKVALRGPEARQLLVVEKFQDKLFVGQGNTGAE